MRTQSFLLALGLLATGALAAVGNPTNCNGKTYTYNQFAGFGYVPANATDKFGDTMSIGSSIAITNWRQTGKGFKGTYYGLPDRG
jgi:hypothetical protein